MARVYLSGPMTGHADFNRPAFHAVAARLRGLGHHVESPAEIPPPANPSWEQYMRVAVAGMLTCDVICMLKGWEASRGATIEQRLARELGFEIWTEE